MISATDIVIGLALVLIIEGTLPLLAPALWQRLVKFAATLNQNILRLIGLITMATGFAAICLIRCSFCGKKRTGLLPLI